MFGIRTKHFGRLCKVFVYQTTRKARPVADGFLGLGRCECTGEWLPKIIHGKGPDRGCMPRNNPWYEFWGHLLARSPIITHPTPPTGNDPNVHTTSSRSQLTFGCLSVCQALFNVLIRYLDLWRRAVVQSLELGDSPAAPASLTSPLKDCLTQGGETELDGTVGDSATCMPIKKAGFSQLGTPYYIPGCRSFPQRILPHPSCQRTSHPPPHGTEKASIQLAFIRPFHQCCPVDQVPVGRRPSVLSTAISCETMTTVSGCTDHDIRTALARVNFSYEQQFVQP